VDDLMTDGEGVMVEPCCTDGGNGPMESPVTVEVTRPIDSWFDVACAIGGVAWSLECRGFVIAGVSGGMSEAGRLKVVADIETLDPCPYMVALLRQKAGAEAFDVEAARGRAPTVAELAAV